MIFWLVAALLAAAVLIFVLRPLFSGAREEGIAPQEVYKAQLSEIEREAAAGLISEDDATSARNEIARRILRAGEGSDDATSGAWDPRLPALSVAVLFAGLALGLYLWLGSPGQPGEPYASRDLSLDAAIESSPAVQELERRLAELDDPADQALLIGDAFAALGAIDEAGQSYLTALSRRPDDAEIMARLAEVEVMRNQGLVTAAGLEWVDRALAIEPDHPAANFYRALYDYQQADFPAAEVRLTQMLESAPPDADWLGEVESFLAEVQGAARVSDQAEAIAGMDDETREAMIRGMVDELAARLESEPDDFEGWLRLANSYVVLGEPEAAREAIARARTLAEGEPVLMRRVAEIEASLSP